jgi:hypothetical protein
MRTFKSEGGQPWFIRFHCETHNMAGRRISWTKTNPKSLICSAGIKPTDWLAANLPASFHGCGVEIITPIHHDIAIVDPDTRECHYDSVQYTA